MPGIVATRAPALHASRRAAVWVRERAVGATTTFARVIAIETDSGGSSPSRLRTSV